MMQHKHMWERDPLLRLDLQFFAEGTAEGGGAEGGAGGAEATPAGGESVGTSTTNEKVYTREDAAAVAKQFKMIPHNGVKERYKSTFDKAGKYDAMASHMGAVAEMYGVSLDDPEGLARAILNDPTRVKAKASELGVTDEIARSIVANDAYEAIRKAQQSERVRQEEFTRLSTEEAAVKEAYPTFDFAAASGNKAFKVLVDSGVPMKEAYEMSHHASLGAAALEAAKKQGRAEALAEMEDRAGRPREGAAGTTGNSPTDVSKLKGKELDAFLESYLTR